MKEHIEVILIHPDYRSSDVFGGRYLPVGLGYIAEILESRKIGYDVVDLNIDPEKVLMDKLNRHAPKYLGISMMSYKCSISYQLLQKVKVKFPNINIVAGDPHVTANRERVLTECSAIDFGVVGEGENPIVELIAGYPWHDIRGLIYRDGPEIQYAGDRSFISNLDEIPFPKFTRFKLDQYGNSIHLHSSRGCPYKCLFCGAPRILGAKWRNRGVESMMEEINYWYQKGYQNICFNDSNFAVDRNRVRRLCEEIIRLKLSIVFTADGIRADHVDYELLNQMKLANFTKLCFGVESGSDKVLRNLKKGENLAQIEAAIKVATDLNYKVTLFFLIGAPGETSEDVKKSFQLALKYFVTNCYFHNLTPIPGTEFYDWAKSKGYMDEIEGRYPEDNCGFSLTANIQTDRLSIKEISRHLKQARRIERQVRLRYLFYTSLKKRIAIDMKQYPKLLNMTTCMFSLKLIYIISNFFTSVVRRIISRSKIKDSTNPFTYGYQNKSD